MDTDSNIRRSDTPIFVRFREYVRLRDEDRIVTVHGSNYLMRGRLTA